MWRHAILASLVGFSWTNAVHSMDLGQVIQRGVEEAFRGSLQRPTPPPSQRSYPTRPPQSRGQTSRPEFSQSSRSRPAQTRQAPIAGTRGKSKSHAGAAAPAAAAATAATAAGSVEAGALNTLKVTSSPLVRSIVLPIYEDLPISGYEGNGAQSKASYEVSDLGRWLRLMDLAQHPEKLEQVHGSLNLATQFVARERSNLYFNCSMGPCPEDPTAVLTSFSVNGWKGKNEFEQARTHQKFVDDYRDVLMAEAGTVPFDMYVVTPVRMEKYSAALGGMPLDWSGSSGIVPVTRKAGGNGRNAAKTGELRSIELAGHRAAIRAQLPLVLSCELAECEQFLNGTKQRRVYALLKVRVNRVDLDASARSGKYPGSLAEVSGDVVFHKNAELTMPFYMFKPPAFPAPAMTASPWPTFHEGPVYFNRDTLGLIVMKHHPAGAELLDFSAAAQVRSLMDEHSYDKAGTDGTWPVTDVWGPFFPGVGVPEPPFGDDIVNRFEEWSGQRAKALPDTMILRFAQVSTPSDKWTLAGMQLDDGFGGTARPALHVADKPAKTSIMGSVASDALGKPENVMIVHADLAVRAQGLSKYVALRFPFDPYRYTVSVDAAASTQSRTATHTEMLARIVDVSLVPAKAGQILLIDVEPQQGLVYGHGGLLAQAMLEIPTDDAVAPKAGTARARPEEPASASDVALNASFDPDIVGIRLGMTMEDADRLVRKHMNTGRVFDLSAKRPAKGYTDGRLYLSEDEGESILLVRDADGRLAGMERNLLLPAHMDRQAIAQQLVDKYGQPENVHVTRFRWWAPSMGKRIPNVCLGAGSQDTDVKLLQGAELPGAFHQFPKVHVTMNKALSITYQENLQGNLSPANRALCGAILEISIDSPPLQANGDGLLRFVLFDHGAYTRAETKANPPAVQETRVKL